MYHSHTAATHNHTAATHNHTAATDRDAAKHVHTFTNVCIFTYIYQNMYGCQAKQTELMAQLENETREKTQLLELLARKEVSYELCLCMIHMSHVST
jgi:hypothetical protein